MNYKQVLETLSSLPQYLIQYFSNKDNLHGITKIVIIFAVAYFILGKLHTAFFGPLSRIPGPFYTRFMNKPLVLIEIPRGSGYQRAKRLHEKYGDIVRFGPYTVSVASLELSKQVLSTDDLSKGPIYDSLRDGKQPNLFTATNKAWHKNRRRIVSSAFSVKYLNSLEPYMLSCTKAFIRQIEKEIELTKDGQGYGTVDIWEMLQRLAIDVIGETAFGQSFHTIENKNHFIPDAIAEVMRTAAFRTILPSFLRFLVFNYRDPYEVVKKFLQNIIDERHNDESKERNDILQSLINSQKSKDQNDRLKSEEIIDETVLFLIAGSETTSNTIGFIFFELLKHPDKLAKLIEEIDTLDFNEGGVLCKEELKRLPYLNAVINETLRLNPVSPGSFDRYTTKPTVLGSMVLPKHTHVFVNAYHLQTSEKYWPNPYAFIPERWLEGEENVNELEAHLPFSIGSRNCIGRNFAFQEMRLCVATVLKLFEIQPIPSEMKDGEVRRQFITLRIAKNSFNIKMKRRS